MANEKESKMTATKKKVLTIYVDAPIALKFKARAAIEGKAMTSIIRDLIASYVNSERFTAIEPI